MKKEYKAPFINIHAIKTESMILAGSPITVDGTGGGVNGPQEGSDLEDTSKPNSGLMDWDDEEW